MANILLDKDKFLAWLQLKADEHKGWTSYLYCCYFQIAMYPDFDEPFPLTEDSYSKFAALLAETNAMIPDLEEREEVLDGLNQFEQLHGLIERQHGLLPKLRNQIDNEDVFLTLSLYSETVEKMYQLYIDRFEKDTDLSIVGINVADVISEATEHQSFLAYESGRAIGYWLAKMKQKRTNRYSALTKSEEKKKKQEQLIQMIEKYRDNKKRLIREATAKFDCSDRTIKNWLKELRIDSPK